MAVVQRESIRLGGVVHPYQIKFSTDTKKFRIDLPGPMAKALGNPILWAESFDDIKKEFRKASDQFNLIGCKIRKVLVFTFEYEGERHRGKEVLLKSEYNSHHDGLQLTFWWKLAVERKFGTNCLYYERDKDSKIDREDEYLTPLHIQNYSNELDDGIHVVAHTPDREEFLRYTDSRLTGIIRMLDQFFGNTTKKLLPLMDRHTEAMKLLS